MGRAETAMKSNPGDEMMVQSHAQMQDQVIAVVRQDVQRAALVQRAKLGFLENATIDDDGAVIDPHGEVLCRLGAYKNHKFGKLSRFDAVGNFVDSSGCIQGNILEMSVIGKAFAPTPNLMEI